MNAASLTTVQMLFAAYARFLQQSNSCQTTLNHAALRNEIASLPAPYAEGNILLAFFDQEAAGIVAYRPAASPSTAEIKRLYIPPRFRGQGVARALVLEALRQIPESTILLDTDTATMSAAYALYLSVGFREYRPRDQSTAYLSLVR